MAKRARVSAVLLTKNEEHRVRRCLDSVRGWVDEIVVVDGLSTDRTVEICREYGAVVVPHAFSGSFATERNVGADAATGDWIIQLDGDDAVSPELRALLEAMLRDGTTHDAFNVRRKNCFLGHWMMHGGWYHYYRAVYRRSACRFEGLVHEVLQVPGTTGVLEAPILHFPFDSLEQFIGRQNRYTTLEAAQIRDQRGVLPAREVRYQLTWKPLKLFWKSYVKKQGYREGWYGLIFALLFMWVHMMKWAKYWELVRQSYEPAEKPCAS